MQVFDRNGIAMCKPMINYHYIDTSPDYRYHDQRRSAFQDIYARYLRAEPLLRGRVLDIGCGHAVNPTYETIAPLLGQLDGVDPFPAITPPKHLTNRWTCPLEELPVAPNTYDMAYSYNVIEHVENVSLFLKKAIEIIKPGGIYWSMSPNARHPFTVATRIAQALRLKGIYHRKINQLSNEYPAYYRLSHDKRILRVIDNLSLPVDRIDFYYEPCVQWDMYFPAPLRAIPHFLDRAMLLRMPKSSFIFMFRIEKANGGTP
jgi:SAM-dependent methyltransferase